MRVHRYWKLEYLYPSVVGLVEYFGTMDPKLNNVCPKKLTLATSKNYSCHAQECFILKCFIIRKFCIIVDSSSS
jgi:hypothetical protein